jgi:hypothetical protein
VRTFTAFDRNKPQTKAEHVARFDPDCWRYVGGGFWKSGLAALVYFELFRPELDAALKRSDRKKGGRPPMDTVFGPSLEPMAFGASLFKVLVLQALYNLSDAQAEFQILDRSSFGRFLGVDDGDRVPDETPIWRFREALVQADAAERLFARFDAHLRAAGYLAMSGQIVDASIVAAPRKRMSAEERGRS